MALTEMERVAVKAARSDLYQALVRIGRAEAFDQCSAAEMDSVIEAVWTGLRTSMQQQSESGEIPF